MNRGGRDGKVNFGQAEIETLWDTQVYGHLLGSSVCSSGAQERIKAGDRDLSVTSGHKLATMGQLWPQVEVGIGSHHFLMDPTF